MSTPPGLLSFKLLAAAPSAPTWRLQFSEPVTGLDSADFRLAGEGGFAAGATVASVSPEGNGTAWLLRVTPGAGDGKLTPTLQTGTVRDLDGDLLAGTAPRLADSAAGSTQPIILFDANADGRPDMVAADGIRLNLDGSHFGTSSPIPGGIGGGLLLGIDGNGDDLTDLISGAAPTWFRSLGNGSFAPGVALSLGGQPVAAGDFNGDGRADILSVDGAGAVRVAFGNGAGFDGAFTVTPVARTGSDPGVAVGDVNGDGRADLAVVEGGAVRIWFGQTDGRFAAGGLFQGGTAEAQIGFAQTNGDGFTDLVIVKGGSATVRLGDGVGGFAQRIDSAFAMPLAIGPGRGAMGDFTGDGLPDILTSVVTTNSNYGGFSSSVTQTGQLLLSRGLGGGAFGAVENLGVSAGTLQATADLDGNGVTDLIAVLSNSYTYQTYQGCVPLGPGYTCGIGGGYYYYQTYTTVTQNVVLGLATPTDGETALNYVPPRVTATLAAPANGTLYVNDQAFITLTFDKPVTVSASTALWLDNGAAASFESLQPGNQVRFRYTAAIGDADTDLGISGVSAGIRGISSGQPVDASAAIGAMAGQLKVDAPSAMLFENADGRIALWQFDGTAVTRKTLLAEAGMRGDMLAVIDMGVGSDWLLSRCGCGLVSVATVNLQGTGPAQVLGAAGAEWRLAGEAAQGANQARLFWHNDAGQLAFWDMDQLGRQVNSGFLGTATTDWRPAAIADTDGDRQADILWQNADGRVARWRVEAGAVTSQAVIDVVTPDWKLVAAGDLNGDGRADLFYRNAADNRLVARFMDGDAGIGDNQVIGVASTDWSITDLRDMNGDGREDILWRNSSGDFALWTMDGVVALQKILLDHVSPDWQLLT